MNFPKLVNEYHWEGLTSKTTPWSFVNVVYEYKGVLEIFITRA
jgi:hypothetical protein